MRGMDPKTAIPAGMRPGTEFPIPSYFGCVAQPICNGLQGSVIIAGCLKPRAEVNDSFVLPCRVRRGLSHTLNCDMNLRRVGTLTDHWGGGRGESNGNHSRNSSRWR